jgi:hypothetical protein
MNAKMSRRAWMTASVAGVLVPLVLAETSASAQSAPVDPNDPTAKALGYATTSPKPDQTCSGCALFQGKAGDAQGGCAVFQGKTVPAGAWCKSWTKKG